MSQSIPATKSSASTAVSSQAALPVKKSPAKFQLSTSEKIGSTINELGYYPITGQVVGILRTIYGVAKALLNGLAAFFAGYVLCNAKKAAEFAFHYKEGLQQVQRGLIELIPFGGKIFYQQYDAQVLDQKKTAFYKQNFKTEVLKELPSGFAAKKEFDAVVNELNTVAGQKALSHVNATKTKEKFIENHAEAKAAAEAEIATLKKDIEERRQVLNELGTAIANLQENNEIGPDQKAIDLGNLEMQKAFHVEKIAEAEKTIQEREEQLKGYQKALAKLEAAETAYLTPKARLGLVQQHKHLLAVHSAVMQDVREIGKERDERNKKIQKQIVLLMANSPLLESDKAQIVSFLNEINTRLDKAIATSTALIKNINKGLVFVADKDKAAKLETLERAILNYSLARDEVSKKIALVQSGNISAPERKQIADLLGTEVNKVLMTTSKQAAAQAQTKAAVAQYTENNLVAQGRYDALAGIYASMRKERTEAGEETGSLLYIIASEDTGAVSKINTEAFEGFVKQAVANLPKAHLAAMLDGTSEEQIAELANRIISILSDDVNQVVSGNRLVAMQQALFTELTAMQKKLNLSSVAVEAEAQEPSQAQQPAAAAPSLLGALGTVFNYLTSSSASQAVDESELPSPSVAASEVAQSEIAEENDVAPRSKAMNALSRDILDRLTKAAVYNLSQKDFQEFSTSLDTVYRKARNLVSTRKLEAARAADQGDEKGSRSLEARPAFVRSEGGEDYSSRLKYYKDQRDFAHRTALMQRKQAMRDSLPAEDDRQSTKLSSRRAELLMDEAEAMNKAIDEVVAETGMNPQQALNGLNRADRVFDNVEIQVPELAVSSLKRQAAPKADKETQTV